jgi:hypothetical protein
MSDGRDPIEQTERRVRALGDEPIPSDVRDISCASAPTSLRELRRRGHPRPLAAGAAGSLR